VRPRPAGRAAAAFLHMLGAWVWVTPSGSGRVPCTVYVHSSEIVERVKGWIIAEQELAELKRMISPGEMRVTYEQQLCIVTKEWSFGDDDN